MTENEDQTVLTVGKRKYRATDTGKPLKNVSRETTSPVYEGGIVLEVETKESWSFIDRFEDSDALIDFLHLASSGHAKNKSL